MEKLKGKDITKYKILKLAERSLSLNSSWKSFIEDLKKSGVKAKFSRVSEGKSMELSSLWVRFFMPNLRMILHFPTIKDFLNQMGVILLSICTAIFLFLVIYLDNDNRHQRQENQLLQQIEFYKTTALEGFQSSCILV